MYDYLDEGWSVISMFLDFNKGFDCVEPACTELVSKPVTEEAVGAASYSNKFQTDIYSSALKVSFAS